MNLFWKIIILFFTVMFSITTIIVLAYGCSSILASSKFQQHFQWNILDYEFPTEKARIQALRTGRFIPENNLPVGIETWSEKIFVTVPRWRAGNSSRE